MFYPSSYFRKKALAALKGHWQTALLIALIVNLPTLMIQAFSAFTGNDLTSHMEAFIISSQRDGMLTEPPQQLINELQLFLNSTGFRVMRGLELLAWLITPCLALGMYSWMINRLRGLQEPVSTVFCRIRLFFKAIGLQLLIILKVLLWTLPGIAAAVVLTLLLTRSQGAASLTQISGMMLPLTLLAVVPAIIAALRYALSEFIMADRPESKILFCIRRSKALMQDRKKNLFFLMFSFIGWYLLELVVSSLLTGILSLLFQMLAGLVLSVYLECSLIAFWMQLEGEGEKAEAPNPENTPEQLN